MVAGLLFGPTAQVREVHMPEWWNNWGCCCGSTPDSNDSACPCACYTFNDTPNDNVGSLHLEGHYAAYDTGKLGKAAKFTGTQYFDREHANCFVPQSTGINIWFWIHRAPPSGSGTGSGVGGPIEYVVSKGEWNDDTIAHSSGSNDCAFEGTWSIHSDPDEAGGVDDLYFTVAYENGCAHSWTFKSYEGSGSGEWVFIYIWYEPNAGINGLGRASIIRNDTAVVDESTVDIAVEGIDMRKTCDEPLVVGKKLGASQSETVLIDNLGFCKDIGTKAEMTARAAALYNSGNGVACNASGK